MDKNVVTVVLFISLSFAFTGIAGKAQIATIPSSKRDKRDDLWICLKSPIMNLIVTCLFYDKVSLYAKLRLIWINIRIKL